MSDEYPSFRSPVYADACVASSQPLAAQAGLAALARGGNALDAALCAAITLTVVEPTMNGLGGDLFAIVHDGRALHGLNASGPSPAGWDSGRVLGSPAMPVAGWDTVTVPGQVAGWATLHARFGRLPFGELFEPAIRYAHDGFLVPEVVARHWALQVPWFERFDGFRRSFLPGGRAPLAGERFRHPDLAGSLARLQRAGADDFYRGELAAAIVAHAARDGGALRAVDLARYEPQWVAPLSVRFAGHEVHELPPNGQGLAALLALAVLDVLGVPAADASGADDPEAWHLVVEAVRVARSIAAAHLADPGAMREPAASLLEPARVAAAAAGIRRDRAAPYPDRPAVESGTVYLASADREGMMVSLIQSNYRGFGSGLVVPGHGIALHNRGACFSTDPSHPNAAAPGKRPLNTIIPGFITRAGAPWAAFGVMGGTMQPQGHVQLAVRLLGFGQGVQAAIDAPRWRIADDGGLMLEEHVPASLVDALAARGHPARRMARWSHESGAAQVIARLPAGGYVAGSESRRDGLVAGL